MTPPMRALLNSTQEQTQLLLSYQFCLGQAGGCGGGSFQPSLFSPDHRTRIWGAGACLKRVASSSASSLIASGPGIRRTMIVFSSLTPSTASIAHARKFQGLTEHSSGAVDDLFTTASDVSVEASVRRLNQPRQNFHRAALKRLKTSYDRRRSVPNYPSLCLSK